MTTLNRQGSGLKLGDPTHSDDHDDWLLLLRPDCSEYDDAVRRLHGLMLRAARHQVAQMRVGLARHLGRAQLDEIVNAAAGEATVAVLSRLRTFEGRSRFTTWAYKFGILHAALEVRRSAWRGREVDLAALGEPASGGVSPEQFVEAADFSAAVRSAIDRELTAHQRGVVLALVVENVPIDVLAERLGSTRNALYKTLHDARVRLRASLAVQGYLSDGGA